MIWKFVERTTLVILILLGGIMIGLIGNIAVYYYLFEYLNVSI